MLKSAFTAVLIATAIQIFTVGILAPKLPREVCQPGVEMARTFSFASAPALCIENKDGAAHVSTSDSSGTVEVEAKIRVYTDSAESIPLAESYVASFFKVTESEDLINIVTEPEKRPDTVDLRVDYTITVPEGTDIALQFSNGNVWVGPGCNHVKIEGNNSDIEVLAPRGRAHLKTVNGRISAQQCADETVLETVNGSIVASLRQGALQASTITGSITATLLEKEVGVCDLTSMNGSITLVMSEQPSVEVNATTARGAIRADLPLVPADSVQRRREIHGVLGKGDTKVSANSLNGDVIIQRSVT